MNAMTTDAGTTAIAPDADLTFEDPAGIKTDVLFSETWVYRTAQGWRWRADYILAGRHFPTKLAALEDAKSFFQQAERRRNHENES